MLNKREVTTPPLPRNTTPCLGNAKAVNAETTVTLQGPSSKETYLSRCKDDPATEYVDEAVLKVADYEDLCK